MRAIFLSIIAAAVAAQSWAQCETSTLQVHTDLHKPIKVYIDGSTGSNPPTVGVIVNDIPAGKHRLKVVQVTANQYGEDVRKTVYSGDIDVHPSVYMDARVDEGRGIAIHDTHVPCDQQGSASAPASDAQAPPNESTTTTYSAPSTPPVAQLPAHISDADLRQLINTIIAAKYEIKKMDTLKATIGTSQLSTDQVRQVMALFSFESNKLDVAKLLYDHTVDKQNYASLESTFNFTDKKEEFKKFVAGK